MPSRHPSLELPEPPAELAELSEQLCTKIIDEIETHGCMGFERYMTLALYEPGLGYYVNGLHKLGADGDFITAPEQGPTFARMLARQLDEIGHELGPGWTVMEPGAGSGVLARDMLGHLDHPPERYLILEPSAMLRQVQAETLSDLPENLRERVAWIDRPPETPFDGVMVANEVIDALPAARFRIGRDGPEELAVAIDNGRLTWTTRTPGPRLCQALDALLAGLPHPLPEGYESEIQPDLPSWLETISSPLRRGAILLVDYGYPCTEYYHQERETGTLVCNYRHRAHFDPFVWPGLTDLSTFVDFTACARAAVECNLDVAGFTSQAGFLISLGIAGMVEQAESDQQRLTLSGEIQRLTLPGEMGEKFKVLGLTRDFDTPLSGFEMMSQLHRL